MSEYEYGKYNPKKDAELRRMRRAQGLKLFQYKNPIPDQVTDPAELKKFFDKFRLIPYAGTHSTTGHRYLHLLRLLRKYSDTHGACITSKMRWAFGGKLKIEVDRDSIFDFEEEINHDVPLDQKKAYAEYVHNAIKWDAGGDPRKLVNNAIDDKEWSGNCYVELVHSNTAGVWSHYAYVHQPEHCLYRYFEPGEQPFIVISPNFSEDYLRRFPPDIIPTYPAYKREGNTYRTIIHMMDGNYPYYGRPRCEHGLLPIFNEFQNSEFIIKNANSYFMAQVLVEFEDADGANHSDTIMNNEEAQSAGYDNAMDRFEINYSVKGDDPSSAIVTSRPHGSRPAFVHEFKPNTNDKHYQTVTDVNYKKIIRAHEWSARLLGDDVSNGFSTNVFLDEFSIKNVTVIRELQNDGNELYNTIVKQCLKIEQRSEFYQLYGSWVSPYEDLIKQKEEAENETE